MTHLCDHCEQILQPYLDRVLSADEQADVERHLADCAWCTKRFRLEADLRVLVRAACSEPMAPELKEKLASLRTPLI